MMSDNRFLVQFLDLSIDWLHQKQGWWRLDLNASRLIRQHQQLVTLDLSRFDRRVSAGPCPAMWFTLVMYRPIFFSFLGSAKLMDRHNSLVSCHTECGCHALDPPAVSCWLTDAETVDWARDSILLPEFSMLLLFVNIFYIAAAAAVAMGEFYDLFCLHVYNNIEDNILVLRTLNLWRHLDYWIFSWPRCVFNSGRIVLDE